MDNSVKLTKISHKFISKLCLLVLGTKRPWREQFFVLFCLLACFILFWLAVWHAGS